MLFLILIELTWIGIVRKYLIEIEFLFPKVHSLSQSCACKGGRDGVGLDAVQVRSWVGGGAEYLCHGHVAPLGDVVAGTEHILPHTDALKSGEQ